MKQKPMAQSSRKQADAGPIELQIEQLNAGGTMFYVVGTSPLVYNRVAEKARQELLFPRGRLTAADKQHHLKHDPIQEYRSSVYRRLATERGPTRLQFPSPSFKVAMATAALDMPGVAKTKIERLTWAKGYRTDIYGIPQLWMDVVRMADPSRTPDIRTRAILPEWCAAVRIEYIMPMLSAERVSRLLSAAGLIIGVGDARQEKGNRSNGQFMIVNGPDDPGFKRIQESGGMAAQDAALEAPEFFDVDTEDLFTWFTEEYKKRAQDRGLTKAEKKPARHRRSNGEEAPAAL